VGPGGSYGFAIPINQAAEVAAVLEREGRVKYPFIGVNVVSVADAPPDLLAKVGDKRPAEGAVVAGVTPGGPAARAGLQLGDVITRVGDREIKTSADLVAGISERKIDETVPIDVLRDGRKESFKVKVGEYSTVLAAGETEPGRLGVALQTLTAPIAQQLGLDAKTTGAVITDVAPGSPASRAGLAPGDVIREVDRKPVASADEAASALHAGKGAHLLRITNGNGTRFVTVGPQA